MAIRFEEIFPADVVDVQGKPYLFTNLRVIRESIPEGLYAYDVRDDCDGIFWQIQPRVLVNHWGTIIGCQPVDLDDTGAFICEEDEFDPGLSKEGCFIDYSLADLDEYMNLYAKNRR